MTLDRRQFIQLTAASLASADTLLQAQPAMAMTLQDSGTVVAVEAATYSWKWNRNTDIFVLRDHAGRVITEGLLQPTLVMKMVGESQAFSSNGKVSSVSRNRNRLTVTYEGVNGRSLVQVAWRFDSDHLSFEPVTYYSAASADVVSLHYFAKAAGATAEPSLRFSFLVQPGFNESSAVSSILPAANPVDITTWLGHGGGGIDGVNQQWGLPSHYFCGVLSSSVENAAGSLTQHLSDAFCCGLANLPAQDLLLHVRSSWWGDGACSPMLNVRSDLWGQARGPGAIKLGAEFYWAIGNDYRDAIRRYYLGLAQNRIIRTKINSAAKNATVTASAFDTWGSQVAAQKGQDLFDGAFLRSIYDGLKASGMQPGIFILDSKWEGQYGLLEHSEKRFPHFEAFLTQLRSEGRKIGLWAAFLRCQDPHAVGLTLSHMISGLDGKPLVGGANDLASGGQTYYFYDVTQLEVQQVLTELVRRFMRRYQPDVVKFDFGYELPSLSGGAPKDMKLAGERLFMKGVQVVVDALRDVNPDVVVMYYSLSPLFIDYFDLNSPDDLFQCVEDYALAANRRFFYSSLLGEIGMPTYGSGGYDWGSMREIWFDSAVVGSVGSLGSFSGDEVGDTCTQELAAKYNGLAHITRTTNLFSVIPLDPVLIGSITGAHSSSWVRMENGEPVLIALRRAALLGADGGRQGYKDLIQCSTSVVIASKTESGVAQSRKLGIVPYGDGEIAIRNDSGRTAEIISHVHGGSGIKETAQFEGGLLRIPLREHLENGTAVEWVEVNIS